jgi:hypothetical protein
VLRGSRLCGGDLARVAHGRTKIAVADRNDRGVIAIDGDRRRGVGRSKADLCVTDFGRFGGVLGLG